MRHELYAGLMPLAFESFNFDEFDLVISIHNCIAIQLSPNLEHAFIIALISRASSSLLNILIKKISPMISLFFVFGFILRGFFIKSTSISYVLSDVDEIINYNSNLSLSIE